jgi:hypothetical protein
MLFPTASRPKSSGPAQRFERRARRHMAVALTEDTNLAALTDLSGTWIDQV